MTRNEMNKLYTDLFATSTGRLVLADILMQALVSAPVFKDEAVYEVYKAGVREHALQIASRAGVDEEKLAYALAGVLPSHPIDKEQTHE